jgi:hypothetical protein
MAQQNINQYAYSKLRINVVNECQDMSLASDEVDYNQEVVFSPYLIAETYGNKLPISINISDTNTAQNLTLNYKEYNFDNIFVSQNYYNPKDEDLSCFSSSTACDIGLTGIDNGLVTSMNGEVINFTNGLYDNSLKFERLYFDRRFKMFQVTGYTSENVRISGIPYTTLYEVVSKTGPTGKYHELYGGFYQGFYKLFGYDYEVMPERMNKGWSVEMLLKPRLVNEYFPGPGQATLNDIHPQNKNIFFYFGTRAENKFYHHADGTPDCYTGYTRVTNGLEECVQTCACCNQQITDSRCIYVYPPRSENNQHDPHLNYGCDICGGNKEKTLTCGCNCGEQSCETCGWECFTHQCETIIIPTPTPTPTPSPTPDCNNPTPVCTPTCTTCDTCEECLDCPTTGFTSIENTCETNPLFDSMSNAIALKLCGSKNNPQIGVKIFRWTGDCETTGTCVTGQTYTTGYTIDEYCSPDGIYDYCETVNPLYLLEEHWFQVNVVWERYTWLDTCDLWWRGGLGDITKFEYLDSLANNTMKLIMPPITNGKEVAKEIELVNLDQSWLDDTQLRMGRLKIYVNGKIFFKLENIEEIIPRALSTDKERQLGVPFNISWGGGTQGLHENLTFSSCTSLDGLYIQDPECFSTELLNQTPYSGLQTNILLEQNFAGTFEGGISQFRMYVEPLSAPEVKHNFLVLKDTFNMLNPDCPDCNTIVCLPNDFTYSLVDLNFLITQQGFFIMTQNGNYILS